MYWNNDPKIRYEVLKENAISKMDVWLRQPNGVVITVRMRTTISPERWWPHHGVFSLCPICFQPFFFRSEFQFFRFISLAQRLTVPKVDHLASELINLVPRTFSLGVWAGHERHSRKEADSEPSWQALKRRGDWVEYAREVPHTNHKILCDKEIISIYFRKCII